MGIGTIANQTKNFNIEVENGRVPGSRFIQIIGENTGITVNTREHIWDAGPIDYPYLSTAETLFLSSTSASDTTNFIVVRGLDANFDEQTGGAVLTGQSQVEVKSLTGDPITFIRIRDVLNGGSVETLGDVYLAESTTLTSGVPDDLTKVQALARKLDQFSRIGTFTIPNNFTACIETINSSTRKGQDATFYFSIRPPGGTFLTGPPFYIYQSPTILPLNFTTGLEEKSDFRFQAFSKTDGTEVSLLATIYLEEL